jgi:hypothetical protein
MKRRPAFGWQQVMLIQGLQSMISHLKVDRIT